MGSVGLLLFSLQFLGITLASTGLVLRLVSLLTAPIGGPSSLRWSLLGVAINTLALAVNPAVTFAPVNSMSEEARSHTRQSPNSRPYVPPPAAPWHWLDNRDR
jgi:hypothetical protein